MPRWRAISSISLCALDRELARFLVDIFAVRELFLDDVDFGDVFQPTRPFAGPEADDAAHDLGHALHITNAPAIGMTVLK